MHWIGIVFGIIILILDCVFFLAPEDKNLFIFIFGISLGIIAIPFVIDLVLQNKKDQEISEMFLEFSRNLAESVNTGTPVSRSIVIMKKKNYGSLSPHISKLANQIELGIPVNEAFQTFAYDVDNAVISRAVALIREAERAGGEIDYILESVARSISEVEKLKKERKAAIYNLVVQGYIIFFIFIGIMLVMQFKILPLTSGGGTIGGFSTDTNALRDFSTTETSAPIFSPDSLGRQFLYLLIAQGLFTGLIIGKLSEGSIKAGVKHSFIMMIAAFLLATGAKVFISS